VSTSFRRERVTRRIEHVVPASRPWGACWNEVSLAIHAATMELREAGIIGPGEEPADDLIRVLPGGDEIVVFYEIEEAAARK